MSKSIKFFKKKKIIKINSGYFSNFLNFTGAVIDGRILSVSQIQALAAIPDIDTARAGIVQTLVSGAQSVAQCLQSQQNTLVQQLKQRVEQLQSTPEGKNP